MSSVAEKIILEFDETDLTERLILDIMRTNLRYPSLSEDEIRAEYEDRLHTAKDITTALDGEHNKNAVAYALKKLVRMGIMEKFGGGKGAMYYLLDWYRWNANTREIQAKLKYLIVHEAFTTDEVLAFSFKLANCTHVIYDEVCEALTSRGVDPGGGEVK